MSTSEELKSIVRETYGAIAEQSKQSNEPGCCGATSCCGASDGALMAESYDHLSGYVRDADLGLGCGLPTGYARMKEGDVVADLGSGAGNDAFVARSVVGTTGKIYGIDFTDKMIDKARSNAIRLGYDNVEFRHGDIENIPLADGIADVVISNCVLNLVPDKAKAFAETFRILKSGGHFSVSDIVLVGDLPDQFRQSAALYSGCVSGAMQKTDYIEVIEKSGFVNVAIQKEKRIILPDELPAADLSPAEITEFRKGDAGIFSITVYGEKPYSCCGSTCCD